MKFSLILKGLMPLTSILAGRLGGLFCLIRQLPDSNEKNKKTGAIMKHKVRKKQQNNGFILMKR